MNTYILINTKDLTDELFTLKQEQDSHPDIHFIKGQMFQLKKQLMSYKEISLDEEFLKELIRYNEDL